MRALAEVAMRSTAKTLIVFAAVVLHAAVRAQDEGGPQTRDWPRFHVGVGVGHVGSGFSLTAADVGGIPAQIGTDAPVDSGTGRKLVAGFRPLRVVGVEIQYLDLGDGSADSRVGGRIPFQLLQMEASADARVVSALLFIPERAPSIDFYAKVGMAQLDESLEVSGYTSLLPGCVPAIPNCEFDTRVDTSDSAAYAGFGARFKIARVLAVRAEYEAIDRGGGDPATLLSIGIAAEF